MLRLKLNHVSKSGPRHQHVWWRHDMKASSAFLAYDHRYILLTNGEWYGALMFSFILVRIACCWANSRFVANLRRHDAYLILQQEPTYVIICEFYVYVVIAESIHLLNVCMCRCVTSLFQIDPQPPSPHKKGNRVYANCSLSVYE